MKDVLLFVCLFVCAFWILLRAGNTHGVLILVPRKEHAQPPPAYGEPQKRLQLILQTSIRNKGVSHSLPLVFGHFCEEVLRFHFMTIHYAAKSHVFKGRLFIIECLEIELFYFF